MKIGLLGCGAVAQAAHLPILSRLPGVEVMAAEADPTRAAQVAQQFSGLRVVADYRDLLADVDAVVITLPNALHADAAEAAFLAGKHVYLEKPLAVNLVDGRRIVDAWRQSGRVGMIGFNYRFNPLYANAARLVQAGKIGQPRIIRTTFAVTAGDLPGWRQSRQTGGGVLLDLASHHIDLVRYMTSQAVKPETVSAQVASVRSEADTAVLQFQMQAGTLVQIFVSLSSALADRIEINGDLGNLTADRLTGWNVEVVPAMRGARYWKRLLPLQRLTSWPYALNKMREPYHEPSFRLALTQFVQALQGKQNHYPTIEDGWHSLAVVTAAEKSTQGSHHD